MALKHDRPTGRDPLCLAEDSSFFEARMAGVYFRPLSCAVVAVIEAVKRASNVTAADLEVHHQSDSKVIQLLKIPLIMSKWPRLDFIPSLCALNHETPSGQTVIEQGVC